MLYKDSNINEIVEFSYDKNSLYKIKNSLRKQLSIVIFTKSDCDIDCGGSV